MTIRLFLVPVTGRVTSVVAVGPSQRVAQFDQQLTLVAQSLAFDVKAAEAAAAGLSDGAADSKAWLAKLRGKLLTQMSSSTGFASKKVISLSADGAYTYNSDSLLSINVGEYGQAPSASASSGGRKADGGKWRIVTRGGQTYLELRSAQGPVTHIQLSRQGNTTLLDGVRTFVTDP
jgi:hypothetical protein